MIKLLLFIAFAILSKIQCKEVLSAYPLEKLVYPHDLSNNAALREFARLVEINKLNVSLIVSTTDKHSNGKPKDVFACVANFPRNSEHFTDTSLSKEQLRIFIKKATDSGLGARSTLSQGKEFTAWTNNIEAVPNTESLRLLTTVKNGSVGIVLSEPNYAAQYTYNLITPDGYSQTTKILSTDLNVEVVATRNLSKERIEHIRRIIISASLEYSGSDVPKAISILVSKAYQGIWNVVTGTFSDNHYIDSLTYGIFKTPSTSYLIAEDLI